jgi:CDGSH-type Zn-finger protein
VDGSTDWCHLSAEGEEVLLYNSQHETLMQPSKVRKTPQKPTICPCGSTANAPKSRGQSTFNASVNPTKLLDYFLKTSIMTQPPKGRKTPQRPAICQCGNTANAPKSSGQTTFDVGVCNQAFTMNDG